MQRLKLTCDEPLSNFAFNFNLRRYSKVHVTGSLALTLPCPEEQGLPAMSGDVKLELTFDQLYVPDEISASFQYFCVGGTTTKIVISAEIKNATFNLGRGDDTQVVENLKLKMEAVPAGGLGASEAGGSLRTSTRPPLNILLSARMYENVRLR